MKPAQIWKVIWWLVWSSLFILGPCGNYNPIRKEACAHQCVVYRLDDYIMIIIKLTSAIGTRRFSNPHIVFLLIASMAYILWLGVQNLTTLTPLLVAAVSSSYIHPCTWNVFSGRFSGSCIGWINQRIKSKCDCGFCSDAP